MSKRKAQEEPAAEPEDEVDDLAIGLLDAEGLTGQLEVDAADEDGGKVAGATLGDFLDDDELPEGITEEALKSEENVDLSSASLSLVQAQRVAQLLASNDALASIKFDGHTVDVESMRTDEELEWESEDYCDVEAIIIAELLKQNTSVSRLDLARNQIGDAGAVALAEMLWSNSTLEYLNLESNIFGEGGGEAFLKALTQNATVNYLNLMYNSIPTGVQDEIRNAWQSSSRSVGLHL